MAGRGLRGRVERLRRKQHPSLDHSWGVPTEKIREDWANYLESLAERAVELKDSEDRGEPLSTVEDEPAAWLVLRLGEGDERLDDTAEEYFGGIERRMHNLGGLDTPEAKRNAERYTRMLGISMCAAAERYRELRGYLREG